MKHRNRIILILSPFFVMMWQGCTKGFETHTTLVQESITSESDNAVIFAQGKALYSTNCASCHGEFENTNKSYRSAKNIALAINSVSLMRGLSILSQSEIEKIAFSLDPRNAEPSGDVDENGRQIFLCSEENAIGLSRMNKLSNNRFKNSINAMLSTVAPTLLGNTDITDALNDLPEDVILSGEGHLAEQTNLMTRDIAAAYFEVAFAVGVALADEISSSTGFLACLGAVSFTESCQKDFISKLSGIAFRRNLSTAEIDALAENYWDATLTKDEQLTVNITGILQNIDFMYEVYDSGSDVDVEKGLVQLTGQELAARVSYFLTQSPPDSTLKGLADSGDILKESVLSAQIDRLMESSLGRETLKQFYQESYGYNQYQEYDLPSTFLNGQSLSGLRQSAISELDSYFTNITLDKTSTFTTLMTSQQAYVDSPALAQVYGSSQGSITLGEERKGFINRSGMLSLHTGTFTRPVQRGLDILENVLCEEVGDPPPDAPTEVPSSPEGQYASTRVRHETMQEVEGTSCVLCHSRINPLGYSVEMFDTLGRYRPSEPIFDSNTGAYLATVDIDTAVETSELTGRPVAVSGSKELVENLATNDKAMKCLTKHLKKFESKREPASADGCHMNSFLQTLQGNEDGQLGLREAFKKYLLSPEFRQWSYIE